MIKDLYEYGVLHSSKLNFIVDAFAVNPKNGRPAGMISDETYDIVRKHASTLDSAIIYDRDFNYNLYVAPF